jgi:hypothetical protein
MSDFVNDLAENRPQAEETPSPEEKTSSQACLSELKE